MTPTQKRLVEITWTEDYHDCETCGGSQADGAVIKIDGEEVATLVPFAHCFNEDSWDAPEVFATLLSKMGIRVALDNHKNGTEPVGYRQGGFAPDPLPEDAPLAIITMLHLHDEETNDVSRGYRISIDGTPVVERLPVLLGDDKSPFRTVTDALIALSKHCGAEFAPGTIQSWMHEDED